MKLIAACWAVTVAVVATGANFAVIVAGLAVIGVLLWVDATPRQELAPFRFPYREDPPC